MAHVHEEDVDQLVEFVNLNLSRGCFTVVAPCGCVIGVADAAELTRLAVLSAITGSVHPGEDAPAGMMPASPHTH